MREINEGKVKASPFAEQLNISGERLFCEVEGIQWKLLGLSRLYGVGSSMKPGRISRVLRYRIGGISASSRGL